MGRRNFTIPSRVARYAISVWILFFQPTLTPATLGGNGGGNWGFLTFNSSQTLGGSGTVDFTGPGPYNALGLSSGTLTIGPGITVRGQSGYLGYSPGIGGSPSNIAVVNQGTINWANGGNIQIPSTLINSGTITVDAGRLSGVHTSL